MVYSVKEIFYTLQGEGAQAGRPAVFIRFAGCNLWSGLERDRATAQCTFCDTDFVGTDGQNGGKYKCDELVNIAVDLWPQDDMTESYIIFTGGEPCLQLDKALIEALHEKGFELAIETNGTLAVPEGIDWICVSPKTIAPLVQAQGDELKLVYPQQHLSPATFEDLPFAHFYLQPMDVEDTAHLQHNIQASVSYCLQHPQWQLSLQTHKIIGID